MENLRQWFLRCWDLLVLHIMKVLIIFLVSLKSLLTKQRMSHQNGIVATGNLKIVDDLDLPANNFFKPGLEFKCRLRHATVRFLDDAVLGPRSASIKFADSDDHSPLDLLMNTGVATPFYSLSTFWQFMKTNIAGGREKMVSYLLANPRCYVNVRSALRRDPSTFAQLYYHTQSIFEFCALDGKTRYIRFRLIPEDRGAETGIPKYDDLETPWFQEAKPNEARNQNYLKEEYRERVLSKGVTYHLQAQVHEWTEHDQKEIILNSVYAWPEQSHPWVDLATVNINGMLEHDDRKNAPEYSVHRGDHVLYSLANRPECLKLLKPDSIRDPASLDYLRVSGGWARRVRLATIKLFGPAKKIPDKRAPMDLDDESQNTMRTDDVYSIACLPQKLQTERKRGRKQRLEKARGTYQFWGGDLSPPYVKDFPEAEAFTADRSHHMELNLVDSIIDIGLADLADEIDHKAGLAAYDSYYPIMTRPSVSQRFKVDAEFGRQRLNGVNPFMIELCTELPNPEVFPVTQELIGGLLDEGVTLADAIAARRIYSVSYPDLVDIPTKPGCFLCAPICLLYVDAKQRLLPIAIQLGQSPADGPVFTPENDFWLWQTVKTYVQSADAQYQEIISHLLRTHLVMETIAVSTHRQLAVGHPLHKLLIPHLRFTMAINHAARHGLLAEGGPIDRVFAMGVHGGMELLASKWKDPQWTFADYDLENDLKTRGVANNDDLPNYFYRDDARKLHAAIGEFVSAIVSSFYFKDDDVAEDFELQAWRSEIADPEEGNIRGFPTSLNTITSLIELLTTIIFTASGGHSSTNNGQYDMYGYIPNAPGEMKSPPPADLQPRTEQSLADALPKGMDAAEQIATAHLLSIPTETPLGSYHPSFFAGHPELLEAVLQFEKSLEQISMDIEARNRTVDVPYNYLNPKMLYPSVEI